MAGFTRSTKSGCLYEVYNEDSINGWKEKGLMAALDNICRDVSLVRESVVLVIEKPGE